MGRCGGNKENVLNDIDTLEEDVINDDGRDQ